MTLGLNKKNIGDPKLSVVPCLLCCSTQPVVIQKCNVSKSKFFLIFLNCTKEKGFKSRIRDSYSSIEHAKKLTDFWSNFSMISSVTFYKPHVVCPRKSQNFSSIEANGNN